MKRLVWASFLVVILVAAIHPHSELRPVVGIRDIMKYEVDPSADALWDSVSSTVDAAGLIDKQPRGEAEWQEARRNAVTLVEAANLLLVEGRRVATDGHIEDSDVPGILPPAAIEKKIALDRPIFVRRAQALQDAAKEALAAIDAEDPARLFEAGGKLDEACEECHVRYWYPNDRHPPLPAHINLEPKP